MVPEPILGWFCDLKRRNESEEEKDDLNAAHDREACKESHGASDETDLGVKLDLLVFFYPIEGCRVEVDLNQM